MRLNLRKINQLIRDAWNRGQAAALSGAGKSSCYTWSYQVARDFFPDIDPQTATHIARGQGRLHWDAGKREIMVVPTAPADAAEETALTAATKETPWSTVGRTWQLWAYRYEHGLCQIGTKPWLEHFAFSKPLVPVLVEEILSEPYAPEVTHYGWQYLEGVGFHRLIEGRWWRVGDPPTMIVPRTKSDPAHSQKALQQLTRCFPWGIDAAIAQGEGYVVALRVTEKPDDAPTPEAKESP